MIASRTVNRACAVSPCSVPVPSTSGPSLRVQTSRRASVIARKGLGDDLLDFVQAGPKMRKWYGAGERMPADGGPPEDYEPPPEMEDDEDEDEGGDGSTILVLDAESPMGEQVVLKLILARADIKICVKNGTAAKNAFGPYVTPVNSALLDDAEAMRKALKGVGSIVIPSKTGSIPQLAKQAGVSHVVMLSSAGLPAPSNPLSFLDREVGILRDASREASIAASGVRYTIVRAAAIDDSPGGQSQLSICQGLPNQGSSASTAPVAREDLAGLVVSALMCPPKSGGRTLQMLNLGPGTAPEEWVSILKSLSDDEIPCYIP